MATQASASTRGDGDLVGLVRTDGDEWRRPQLLPTLRVDRSMTYGLEVRPPLPETQRW
jgi:hypothetical protein